MTQHLSWETLNDFVDDAATLDANARRRAADHLVECTQCRETVRKLRTLISRASEISEIAPPVESWNSISATIERRKSVKLTGRTAGKSAQPRWKWMRAASLGAAAAAVMFYLIFSSATRSKGALTVTPQSLPSEVVRIDDEFGTTARELSAAMNEPRVSADAPELAQSVARSVAVIDIAIAEARDALIRNPSSEFVRDALVRNYQQKIDLLRRVTARAASN